MKQTGRFLGIFTGYLLGISTSFLLSLIPLRTPVHVCQQELSVNEKVEQSLKSSLPTQISSHDVTPSIVGIQSAKRKLSFRLHQSIRILCWIMTSEANLEKQKAIVQTWGRKCHTLLFMLGGGSKNKTARREKIHPNIHRVYLPMAENYNMLWLKTKLSFRYVLRKYGDTFDWVLKVDDDSFVIMENLRLYLKDKTQSEPYFYGSPYKSYNGYNSGGPGYVLSAQNLEKLVKSFDMPGCSTGYGGAEDIEVAKCLKLVGISTADTRDQKKRFRFSPFEPLHTIHAKKLLPRQFNWWWGFTAFQIQEGLECCSDSVISFHYISPELMRVMEFLIYYASPFAGRDVWTNTNLTELQSKI